MKGGFPFVWGLLILFWAEKAFCQLSTGDFDYSKNDLIIAAEEAVNQGEFESALQFYFQSLAEFNAKKDTLAYVYTLDQIGYCYRRLFDFEKARDYLIRAENEGKQLLGAEHPQMGRIYYHWAYFHYWLEDYPDSAFYFMQKSIELREKALTPDHPDLAKSYHGMGSMYRFMYSNYFKAASYYMKAVKIKEANDPESTSLANTYLFLGQALYNLNDPYASLPYLKAAYRIYNANPKYDPAFKERIVTSLGNVYYYLKDFSQAALYYKESMEIKSKTNDDPTDMLTPLMNLGIAYIDAGNYDLARNILYKSLKINSPDGVIADSAEQSYIYSNIAILHYALDHLDSSLFYFRQSIEVHNQPIANKPLIAESYTSIGEIYLKKNEFEESLQSYQLAIETLEGKFFNRENTVSNPNLNQITYPLDVYNPLAGKARVYFRQYQMSSKEIFLSKANHQYNYLSFLSNSIKTSQRLSDETKLEFANQASNIANSALECLYEAEQQARIPDEDIEQDVLKIMEENRYVQLLSNLLNVKRSKNLDVPDSLLQKEKLLAEQIANYELIINVSTDSIERQQYEKQHFTSLRELDRLQKYIQERHPQYYQKNAQYITLDEIQQVLPPTHQVIEYFWADSVLYALSIGAEDVKFQAYPVNSDLLNVINSMRVLLANGNSPETDYDTYRAIAFDIYQQVLKPLVFDNSTKLIISPDGPLNFIPFEALLTDDLGQNYRDASYILKKWDVQYVYSGSLLLENRRREIESSPSLLAMSYSDTDTPPVIANRNDAADIPASAIEVRMISEIFRNKANQYFTGKSASKQKFKKEASNFQIIHLAIHGFSDTTAAINSHLQFQADEDGNDDGKLYAHELYSLNLENLELAVLSACETGLGKQYRGEGVFSMARGFAYAGCPTTIMSLWKTNDAQTAELMQSFYIYLNKGHEVSNALRRAKLEYIKNHDTRFSNPYYWAGFVSMGSDDPLVKRKDYTMTFLVVGFMILVIVVAVVRRKKQYAG